MGLLHLGQVLGEHQAVQEVVLLLLLLLLLVLLLLLGREVLLLLRLRQAVGPKHEAVVEVQNQLRRMMLEDPDPEKLVCQPMMKGLEVRKQSGYDQRRHPG